ncbi:Clavesin-2, partial [Armadillidium vulgare]
AAFFRTDNEFLGRFLKARKYRVEEAFQVLCKYFTFRHQSRDLCIGLNASSPKVQAALIDGTVGVLPENDPCGRPILLLLASNWNNSKYDVRTIYQAVLITLEHLVENPEVQQTGIIAIIDWSHFPARHATFLTPKTLRVFLEGLQDAFPMRLGALHMVSPPWYIEAALSLSKPFLKEKLRDRIFVHGNNLHTLHSNVPPRILPAELGGEGGEYNAQIWATKLIPPSKLQPSLRSEMKTSISHSGFSGSLDSAGPSKRDHNKVDHSPVTRSLLEIS